MRLGGNLITSPWLITGRLENTGNHPIEDRDIEVPAKLSFTGASAVGAEVVKRSQPALFADLSFKGSEVTLEHKLLNPADWVNFDILFDGEPELPPAFSFRISGVSAPLQRVVSPDEKRAYPAVVALPVPILYLVLTFGSLTGVGAIVGSFVLFWRGIRGVLFQSVIQLADWEARYFDETVLMRKITPSGRDARTVFAAFGESISFELLDQPDAMSEVIRQKVPAGIFDALLTTPEAVAATLRSELKQSLKSELAYALYLVYPVGPDREIREEFQKLDETALSTSDLIELAKEYATNPEAAGELSRRRVNTDDLGAAVLLLLIGVSLVSLLGGTWRTILAL